MDLPCAFFLAKRTQYLHPVPHPASRGCGMWVMPAAVWTSEDRDAPVGFGHTLCGQLWILSAWRTAGAGSEAIGEEHSRREVTYSCRGQREGTEACGGHGVWLWVWGWGLWAGWGELSAAPRWPPFPLACPPMEAFLYILGSWVHLSQLPQLSAPRTPSMASTSHRHHGLCDGFCERVSPTRQGLAPAMSSGPSLVPGREGTPAGDRASAGAGGLGSVHQRAGAGGIAQQRAGGLGGLPRHSLRRWPRGRAVRRCGGRGFWEQESQEKGKQCKRRTLRESRREAYVLLPVLLLLLSHRLTLLLSKKSGVSGRDREKHTRKKAGAAFHFHPYKSGGSESDSFFLSPSFKDINKPKP